MTGPPNDFGELTYDEFFALTQAIVELRDTARHLVAQDPAWVADSHLGPYYEQLARQLAALQQRLSGKTGVPGMFPEATA